MRLYRPAIPLRVQCLVVLRQLGEMFPEKVVDAHRRGLQRLLDQKLQEFATLIGCEIGDLRLDHNPALGTREKTGEGKETVYTPDANDPDHLRYRPHGTQFEGSHDVKTRIRGDHGQYSDITLIKRQRRREKKAAEAKMRNKRHGFGKRSKEIRGRWKWPKRKFPNRKT